MKKIILITLLINNSILGICQITPTDYSLKRNWVINHNIGSHLPIDPSYTIIKPDTNQKVVINLSYDTFSGFNIFCIYPTIPKGGGFGAKTNPLAFDSNEVRPIVLDMFSQYGKYGKLFVPYYRQANVATFTNPGNKKNQALALDTALVDVIASFNYFLQNHNNGKKIILLGHSQGSVLLAMMLRFFERTNPSILNNIAFSVLPGFQTGPHTAKGKSTAGWFEKYSICQTPEEVNCMMTWQTYRLANSLGTSFPLNHIYNDTLVSWGYRFKNFDTITGQILNDPLLFISPDTISWSLIPNDIPKYGNVQTRYIAYESFYVAENKKVSDDFGLIVSRNAAFPSDRRKDSIPVFPANYHVYDHYIAAGAIHEIIQKKIALIPGKISPQPSNAIAIFPNPSSNGVFNILYNSTNAQINWTIYNYLGGVAAVGSGDIITISVKGIYFIHLQIDNSSYVKPLIFN